MKKALSILLVLTIVLVLGGQIFAAGQAETGRPKVAGVVFQEDQFMKLLQSGYRDAAESAGFDFYPGNTNGDAAKEAEFLNTYVTQGYKGLAISPISEEASLKVLTDAANKGLLIGISNHEFKLPFLTGAFTSDNYSLGVTVGKAAANYIKENLSGDVKIAIVQYKTLLPEQSFARSSGFLDQIRDLPGVQIVTDQDAWMQDKAITVAGDIITAHGDIDIIFAANEGGTIGSTMAVKNAGKAGQIVVFGFDGSEQMVQLLKDPANILQAAIAQDPYTIGVKTMESVIKAVNGEDYSDTKGQSFIVPGILLERSNPAGLDAFLEDLKSKM
ncbi:substrate-binding domain-containing protein [Sphaerochaeta halotolerans]|jgi:ABC-type sugar transport system substrate-binding protein|uniref:substrate-binding domain-containing protein n=1 Tax=Sphaerochaeta halotolerans TaxID=2293840 RepID=UPI00137040D4|nr:substrate-binding domain-containing protein [Sphaerochaeta halotolerans]MXI85227.1 substrate-binding domain-containing protein [Sphaerochaeta halotolerans]